MTAARQEDGVLAKLSGELADAVERASSSIAVVNGRRRLPASGIVWPGEVIVTADHVLERDEDISVTLSNGETRPATVAGRDPGSDIAVLRIDGAGATPATLAPAGSVRVGHLALAVGLPGSGAPMVSFGIVSALGGSWRTARGGTIEGYIRADVTLYPGFSGGPLVDVQGQVMGLNSSHLASGQAIAIPSGALSGTVQTLLSHGRIRRAYLGVSSQPVRLPDAVREKLGLHQEVGLMILRVEPGSPAEKGGVFMGDVLVAMDGQPLQDAESLQASLGPSAVGKAAALTVLRGGGSRSVSVTPGERE